jgi:hypothetical protein
VPPEAVHANEAVFQPSRLRGVGEHLGGISPPPERIRTSQEARYCPVITFGPGLPFAFRWMRTRSSMAW